MINFSFLGKSWQTKRVIGDIVGDAPGPTFVFVGGIHGNEPSGVIALQHVFKELEQNQVQTKGRILGLAGNLQALSQGRRFVSMDLNRIWNNGFTKRFRSATTEATDLEAEKSEQLDLLSFIEPMLLDDTPLLFADLHTTSAPSVPFLAINDQLDNRRFALQFPLPTVLGIEEYISGPLLSYLNDFGNIALAFEAGQHTDPETVKLHVAFIYMSLVAAEQLTPEQVPSWDKHRVRLENCGKSHQGIYEVVHRHPVNLNDQFLMRPGRRNFMPVKKGETLASDSSGRIVAPKTGMIFMPLYQERGEDGFFIVRPVPAWAISLSRILRRINFDTALTLLPGVSRSPDHSDTLVVNKRIARWLATDLFHLLGYRRKQDEGDIMIFSRREISASPRASV